MYSAIHFTAKWAVKFEESHPGGFLLPNGKTKMVDMMEMETTLPNILSCVDFPSIPGCEEDPLVPSLINIPFEDPRLKSPSFCRMSSFPSVKFWQCPPNGFRT